MNGYFGHFKGGCRGSRYTVVYPFLYFSSDQRKLFAASRLPEPTNEYQYGLDEVHWAPRPADRLFPDSNGFSLLNYQLVQR